MGSKIRTKKIVCRPNIYIYIVNQSAGILIGFFSHQICGKSAFQLWEFLPNTSNLCFGPSQSLAALRGWVLLVGTDLFHTRKSPWSKALCHSIVPVLWASIWHLNWSRDPHTISYIFRTSAGAFSCFIHKARKTQTLKHPITPFQGVDTIQFASELIVFPGKSLIRSSVALWAVANWSVKAPVFERSERRSCCRSCKLPRLDEVLGRIQIFHVYSTSPTAEKGWKPL